MKYAVIVPDGLGDWPVEELGGKTPMEAAKTPFLDDLAQHFVQGTLRTTPEGMSSGSDVCGLSLMGYNPKVCYSGRAPLEAASLDIVLQQEELAFRTNLVSVEEDILTDYSADHVSTEEAAELIQAVQAALGNDRCHFYPGKMYRHILVTSEHKLLEVKTDAPHDFMGTSFEDHWPKGPGSEMLKDLTLRSRDILEHHPVNLKRAEKGKKKANMIWIWGGGPKPEIEPFQKKFGVQGSVISAVDLVNGIGKYLGWDILSVPGATGYFDTHYQGKGEYAIRALEQTDLIWVHVEATDEAGHSGLPGEKVRALEQIDKWIVGPVWKRLQQEKQWRLFVAPDHYTPLAKRTHSSEPVPFILAGSDITQSSGKTYSEKNAQSTGVHLGKGHALMEHLIHGWK